jgi:hypothetical protein
MEDPDNDDLLELLDEEEALIKRQKAQEAKDYEMAMKLNGDDNGLEDYEEEKEDLETRRLIEQI